MSLKIEVNKEVFKIKDPRVAKLSSGKLTAEMFAHMIGPGDPFVLIDNMIIALTEQEFYATRAILPVNVMSESGFHYVLNLSDISFMHKLDQDFIAKVKKELPTCPACRYKRYKDEVYKLAKKYNIPIDKNAPGEQLDLEADKAIYPEVTEPITPLASLLLQHMYRTEMPVRKDCIDCVEKHLSQAWVLANETVCGYPEHLAFVIAHMGEAIDEMPVEFTQLKKTVEFCLAKTKQVKKPFIPIHLLIPLLNLARETLNQSMTEQSDNIAEARTESMDIDLTQDIKDELVILPSDFLLRIDALLEKADKTAASWDSGDTYSRIAWQGAVGCAADVCAQLCPKFSNMLRNRRLLFIGDISLAASGDYSFGPIREYINTCLVKTN